MMKPRLTLFDRNEALVDAWDRAFAGTETVALHSDLEELEPHDVLVSPANSFGILDGGIDLAINKLLPKVQEATWEVLERTYFGEQPVGTCVIVPTGDERFRYLAHSPTMRWPKPLVYGEDLVIFDCMRAIMLEVERHFYMDGVVELQNDPEFRTIACPGLGTATGRVPAERAAKLMRAGYEAYMQGPRRFEDWPSASERINALA